MPKINIPSLVQKLPQNIRDHLFDDALAEKYAEIFEASRLTDEQVEMVRELIWQVYAKELSLPELLTNLQEKLKLEKGATQKLAIQIIGWDFLPVADFLGVDVQGYLREIGADPHLFIKTASSRDIAEELARNTGLNFDEDRLGRRLVDIILNRLNNVRDDAETKNILTRGVKLGGLELDEVKALKILDLIKLELESLASKRIVLKEEKEKMFKAFPVPPASTVPLAPKVSPASPALKALTGTPPPPKPLPPPLPRPTSTPTPVIARSEVLRTEAIFPPQKLSVPITTVPKSPPVFEIRSRIKPGDILAPDEVSEITVISAKTLTPALTSNQIVNESLIRVREEAGLNFDEVFLKSRFDQALTNRLKDIRDSQETKDLLVRAVNLGGVGLTEEVASSIIKILDNELARVHEDLRAVKEAEIRALAWKKAVESDKQKVEIEKTVSEEMEGRWQRLIKHKNTKTQEHKNTRTEEQENKKTEVAQALTTSFQSPTPKSPVLTLEDVKFIPKLVGPLEEMKNFSLDDLRKLSAKPTDAIRRFFDKLEVLRSEAMEKKIAGIGAFKTSPLWQSYLEIVNQALIGEKNPSDVIASRLALNKSEMSQDEFNAIIELSANLRF